MRTDTRVQYDESKTDRKKQKRGKNNQLAKLIWVEKINEQKTWKITVKLCMCSTWCCECHQQKKTTQQIPITIEELTQINWIGPRSDCNHGRSHDDDVSKNSFYTGHIVRESAPFSCTPWTYIDSWRFSFCPICTSDPNAGQRSCRVRRRAVLAPVHRIMDTLALVHPFCGTTCICASDN